MVYYTVGFETIRERKGNKMLKVEKLFGEVPKYWADSQTGRTVKGTAYAVVKGDNFWVYGIKTVNGNTLIRK